MVKLALTEPAGWNASISLFGDQTAMSRLLFEVPNRMWTKLRLKGDDVIVRHCVWEKVEATRTYRVIIHSMTLFVRINLQV